MNTVTGTTQAQVYTSTEPSRIDGVGKDITGYGICRIKVARFRARPAIRPTGR